MPKTNKPGWIWETPLPGTSLFPHHRRWDCRKAIIEALRWRDTPHEAAWWLGRASAMNAIMYDCHDPLAWRYAVRIDKVRRLLDERLALPPPPPPPRVVA